MKKIFAAFFFFSILFNFTLLKADTKNDTVLYKTESNIFYREGQSGSITEYMKSSCLLDIYYPANRTDFSTVIWFHGGGLTSGSRSIPDELKQRGFAIVTVDYRLSPKALCPDYIDDAAAAVSWVFKNIGRYGGNPEKIVISGHSAGGYLAMMIGLDKEWLEKYQTDANKIKALIPLSGQAITHFTIRKERGIPETQPVIDKYAPLFHVRKNAPPLILITGDRELELLGRYEENAYLMRAMKLTGHTKTELYELDGFDHVGMLRPGYELLLKFISREEKGK